MSNTRGIGSLKTASSAHIYSIPNSHRSAYLDLFMLQKEKEKLQKESKKITDRLENHMNRINEVDEQMTKLSERQGSQEKRFHTKKDNDRPISPERKTKWETMSLGY